MIGKVLVDGHDANLEQVRRGCGWHYKRYMNEQPHIDRLAYNAAEESARAGRVGLWADRDPVLPWDWRRARESNSGARGGAGIYRKGAIQTRQA